MEMKYESDRLKSRMTEEKKDEGITFPELYHKLLPCKALGYHPSALISVVLLQMLVMFLVIFEFNSNFFPMRMACARAMIFANSNFSKFSNFQILKFDNSNLRVLCLMMISSIEGGNIL